MKGIMEMKQGAHSFHVENSKAPLLEIRKIVYKHGKYTCQKIIDFMGFSTINMHCNVIYGVKDNGNDKEILDVFALTRSPGYLINIIPNNVLYQNETNTEPNIELHIKDEHGRRINFNGDVLSFTLH